MTTSLTALGAATDPHTQRRAVVAGAAGNLVANFDGALFAFLAPMLAPIFYPTKTPGVALLLVLATYGSGFLMKPIGALVFGSIGDRWGRRPALYGSIGLMGLSSLIVAVTPGYAVLGVVAPVILVAARLLEGLAMGAEYGLATTYLAELAPRRRRALVSSSHQVTMIAGTLLASAVATLFTSAVPSNALSGEAWRIPFAGATLLCALVAVLRSRVGETPVFAREALQHGQRHQPALTVLRRHPATMVRAGALSVGGIVSYHVWLQFLPGYAHATAGVDLLSAQIVNTVALTLMLVLIPVGALLSDRFGRRPTMLAAALGIGLLACPALLALHVGFSGFLFAQLTGSVLLSLDYANGPALKAELFPTPVRAVGVTVPYALAGALFGSTASVLTGHFTRVGNPMLFGVFLVTAYGITAIALAFTPETKDSHLE